MLWYDTANNILKVYNGSAFVEAGSSVNGTAERSLYTATAAQTVFNATYDVGFVDVYLNGVKLAAGTDFTATNGTSITLATGAALNDVVDIVAYGAFSVANTYTQAQADARFLQLTGGTITGDLTIADKIVHAGDTNTAIRFPAADTVTVETAGSERLRVADAGQIGIGGANYGTSGQVLTSGGPSAAPSWTSVASALNASGSAPIYACRAWVNFNGTGTVAIRASGNVSSITDNGTGNYTVNFTTAMPDANYAINGFAKRGDDLGNIAMVTARNSGTYSTSAVEVLTYQGSWTLTDFPTVCVTVFR
jgi:hypothetical protein